MKNKHRTLSTIFFLLLFAACSSLAADIVVITNKSTKVDSLSAKEVKSLFLQKSKSFPDGSIAVVGDQPSNSSTKKEFNKKILKKSSKKLKRYWSKLIFSGKAVPPKVIGNDEAMKKWVAGTPNSLGYIDAKFLDDSVKVLLKK